MINLKLSEKIINEISKSLKNGQNKEIITPLIENGKEFSIRVNFCGYPNYKYIEICLRDLDKKNEHNPTKLIYINHYLTYLPKIESIYNILLSLFNLIQLNYDNVIKANKNDYLISIKGSHKKYLNDGQSYSLSDCNIDYNVFKNMQLIKKPSKNNVFVPILEHPDFKNLNFQNYPRLGRGEIIKKFHGIEESILNSLSKGDILLKKQINKKGIVIEKEYLVVNVYFDSSEKLATLIPIKLKVCNQDSLSLFLEQNANKLLLLIGNKTINDTYSDLFPCNRIGLKKKFFKV